jgi:hypothetical protein
VLGQAFAVTAGRGRTAGIGRPCSAGSRFAVVLVAAVLAACGPSSSPGSTPGAPGGSAPPSPAAEASDAPTQPILPEAPIEAITYSEDPASALFAVAEFGPNEAGISRVDLYRGADGRLASIVAHGPEGLPAVIAFDLDGRPVRMDARGYEVEFSYPSPDVEIVITAPDGSVDRLRGPVDLSAAIPAPAAPNARLVSYNQEPPLPGMVQWPIRFYSYSVVDLEVVTTGTNPGPTTRHVRFRNAVCALDSDACDARIDERDGQAPRVWITSSAAAGEKTGSDAWIWRTRADCDRFTPLSETLLAGAGLTLLAGGAAYQILSLGQFIVAPLLGLALFGAGVIVAMNKADIPLKRPRCGSVPNLEVVQEKFFNQRAGNWATLTVTALGDCGDAPTTGWRIKEPTRTVTFQPFLPNNRAVFDGSGLDRITDPPVVGTITFDAADCGKEMTGAVDLKNLYPTAAQLAAIKQLVAENHVSLTLTDVEGNPNVKATVTGDLELTIRLDGAFLWRIHESVGQNVFGVSVRPMPPAWADCAITSTIVGTLEGRQSAAGGQGLKGRATITSKGTITGCEDTNSNLKVGKNPAPLKNVPWTAEGDDALMRGIVHLKGMSKAYTYDLAFVVRPKATTP